MGLSRILTSFPTISFTWFYLFIMLGNAEAKIGKRSAFSHTQSPSLSLSRVCADSILTLVFVYHNYGYLHNINDNNYSLIVRSRNEGIISWQSRFRKSRARIFSLLLCVLFNFGGEFGLLSQRDSTFASFNRV